MQAYLNHVLADLAEAQLRLPEPLNYRLLYPNHPAPEGLEYIIEWENAPQVAMDDLFGVSHEVFPPAERLTDAQVEALILAILALWGAFNFEADFPPTAPARQLYTELVAFWRDEPVKYTSEGTAHLCLFLCLCDRSGDCQWGDACHCKDA